MLSPKPPISAPFPRSLKWLIVGGIVILVSGMVTTPLREWRASKLLQEELRAASQEGIITTEVGMRLAAGPPPPDTENALPVLLEISRLENASPSPEELLQLLAWHGPGGTAPFSNEALREAVKNHAPLLDLADRCAERSQIWEDADWRLGNARPLDYFVPLRRAASALMVRAECAKAQGQDSLALDDLGKAVRLSDLALGVKDGSGFSLGCWLREDVEDLLIRWSSGEPPASVWLRELEQLWSNQEVPDPQSLLKTSLYEWLATMDMLQTPGGREAAGALPSDARSVWEGNWNELLTLNEGKLKMVTAFREIWRTVSRNWPSTLDDAAPYEEAFVQGALSDPYAATPFFIESEGSPWRHHSLADLMERRTLLEGVVRVLRSAKRDETVSMEGLVSPVDGSRVILREESRGGYSQMSRKVEPVRSFLVVEFDREWNDGIWVPVITGGKNEE